MRKNCPFCGAEMPEEANFCLTCFSMYFSQNELASASFRHSRKTAFRPHIKRRTERLVSVGLSCFLLSGVLLTAFSSVEKVPMSQQPPNISEQTQGTQTNANATANNASDEVSDAVTDGAPTPEEPVRLSGMAESVFGKVPGLGLQTGAVTLPGTGNTGTQSTPVGTQPDTETAGPGNTQANTDSTESENNTTAKPEEAIPTEPEYDHFEYVPYSSKNDKITLTKYTGNSSVVLVPAVIDGKPVARIEENTFADNPKIQEIIFESDSAQTFLWMNRGCMQNLPSLKTVRMPKTDLGIYANFATGCLKLENIQIESKQYVFQDGALYYWNSREWELLYYAPACKNETLTVASWCAGTDGACNLEENPYLKRINLHKDVKYFPSNYRINDALEYVYVEPGNTKGFSVDGVLFYKDSKGVYNSSLYPPSKKDKTFVMPENVTMSLYRFENPYLEELWIPLSSGVNAPSNLYFRNTFTNLKAIHLQKGHSYEAACKSTFTGRTEMY